MAAPPMVWPRPKTVSRLPSKPVAPSASTSHASVAPLKNVNPRPRRIEARAQPMKGASICHIHRYSNVEIKTALHFGLPTIRGSLSEMQQVLLNLINNALDAMEHTGGTLEITAKVVEGNLWISVYENDGLRPPTFTLSNTIGTDSAESVYAADVDGDGDTDVVSAHYGEIVWWDNPSFGYHEITSSVSGAQSVFAADINGDGDIDVLSASYSDDKIAWHDNLSGDGTFWTQVRDSAQVLKDCGLTAVWLPPAYKGQAGAYDVGYGVYDLYDLGEFDQKGSVRTKYGTRAQYLEAVQALQDRD